MLLGSDRVYLDSNAVIAIVEGGRTFSNSQLSFIKGIDSGSVDCVSSDLAMAECLVLPLRQKDDKKLEDILIFFGEGDVLPIIPFTRKLFIRAAEIRAVSNVKMPDAMHIACADVTKCTVFMSADAGIRLPKGMRRVAFQDLAL